MHEDEVRWFLHAPRIGPTQRAGAQSLEPSQSALQGSDDCGGMPAPSSPAHDVSPPEPSAPSPPTQPCPSVEDPLAAEKIVPDQQGHERTSAPQPLATATSAAQARRLAARKRRKLDAVARAPCDQLLENGGETSTSVACFIFFSRKTGQVEGVADQWPVFKVNS